MTNILDDIHDRARSQPKHIVLSEGLDQRIVRGAVRAACEGLAKVTVLGTKDAVAKLADLSVGKDISINIINPAQAAVLDAYADAYFDLRKHKGISRDEARAAIELPLNFANMMVRLGHADGSISGAINTTSDVVRSALQIIGMAPQYKLVSSLFLMIMDKLHHPESGGVVFADCGLVIDPDTEELVEIASAAADNARLFLNTEPKLALLSFSTKGSAEHAHVKKMREATQILKSKRPDLTIDGELQFDAAIIPEIANRKAPGSSVAGEANVFIFPDLNAGNIGYKIAERIGGATAIGPILQGLSKPANDLSRGCTAEDVYNMIAITVRQAQAEIRP